jgi:hypothetical protein
MSKKLNDDLRPHERCALAGIYVVAGSAITSMIIVLVFQ